MPFTVVASCATSSRAVTGSRSSRFCAEMRSAISRIERMGASSLPETSSPAANVTAVMTSAVTVNTRAASSSSASSARTS